MARTPQSAPRKRREKRRGGEIPELEALQVSGVTPCREGLWRVCGAKGAGLCGGWAVQTPPQTARTAANSGRGGR